jgi:hypothetical protein
MNVLLVVQQHALKVDLERQQAEIALATNTVDADPRARAGERQALRGIPCSGFGGATAESRPEQIAENGGLDRGRWQPPTIPQRRRRVRPHR